MLWFYIGFFFYVIIEAFIAYIVIVDKRNTKEDKEFIIVISLVLGVILFILLWPIFVPVLFNFFRNLYYLHKREGIPYRDML